MTDSYFCQTDQGLAPEAGAHGPWAEDMLHGRLLGGLAARALEADFGQHGWRAARLTVDLFRPAAMAPVQVETRPIRQGRRVRVGDALLTCDGREVGRATAVFLTVGDEPPGNIWRPTQDVWPDPETLSEPIDGTGESEPAGWLFRTVEGGFGTGKQTRVWTNDTVALVDDETLTPFVRAAVSGDIACPLANSSDQGLYYINADYTMLLGRYPVGDWIGIEIAQQIAADGISVALSTLVDRQGPFATSGGSSLARPPI